MEGLAVPQVKDKYSELFTEWSEHPERVRLPGGETLDDVQRRSMLVVEKLIREQEGAVALVTHRVVIKCWSALCWDSTTLISGTSWWTPVV